MLAEVFDSGDDVDWNPRYNIAPSQSVPVVRQDATRPVRSSSLMRWGLIPSWAKDAKAGYKMINARAEIIAEKPAFREPLLSRRCLIPADGFYEWVRHEVACVTVRRALPDRTCHPIGSTLRGMAFRKRIV
ncbi:MAG: SOS response-associated peptidase [Candidatus Sulfotelmatobacter sp.]